MRFLWLAVIMALLAACGSGGGSAVDQGGPGTATIGFSTQASSGTTVIYAAEFTLHLPAGVAVSADPSSGEVASGVLHPLDSTALVAARYVPATTSTQASVKVVIIDSGGFPIGDLATLSCIVAPGTAVNASQVSLDGFSAKDVNGAAIPGITPNFTVKTQ